MVSFRANEVYGGERGRRRFWGLLVVRLDLVFFPFSVSSSNSLYEGQISCVLKKCEEDKLQQILKKSKDHWQS